MEWYWWVLIGIGGYFTVGAVVFGAGLTGLKAKSDEDGCATGCMLFFASLLWPLLLPVFVGAKLFGKRK